MAETVIALLIFAGISTFCWLMVFRSSTRRKLNQPGYDFWRPSKQGREDQDAVLLAGYLIGAMVFSLMTLVFIGVGLYRLVAR